MEVPNYSGRNHVGGSATRLLSAPVRNSAGISSQEIADVRIGMAISQLSGIDERQESVRGCESGQELIGRTSIVFIEAERKT